jgi:hypothetical protein
MYNNQQEQTKTYHLIRFTMNPLSSAAICFRDSAVPKMLKLNNRYLLILPPNFEAV